MEPEPRLYRSRPGRLLVVGAHPDDADRAMAGSVMQWVQAGTVARLVCCTSGDSDADDVDADPLELAARREQEQRTAASMVGYEGVTFLHRPDGALVNDLALREQLVRLIRTFRPDALAAPDPTVMFPRSGGIQHVDHREAGLAGADAIDPSARPMAFPQLLKSEGLAPHRVRQLFLYWPAQARDVVDISASVERKIEVLREHHGSLAATEDLGERVNRDAADDAVDSGAEAAEAFSIIDLW